MSNTEWSNATKYVVGIGLVIFGIYVLYLSRSVLTLLILAALIAFLLMPVVSFFHRRLKAPRGVAVLLAYLLLTVIILLAPLVFLPPIIDSVNFFADLDYQILVDGILNWTEQTLITLKGFELQSFGFTFDLDPIIDRALEVVQNTGSDLTPSLPGLETILRSLRSAVTITYGVATNVAGTVFAGALSFIVTLLSAIYLSLDAPKLGPRFLSIVPRSYRPEIARLLSRLRRTWRAYFRGQLKLMFIIGITTWIGNMIIGLPGAFALAVVAGVMELIPNLGPFLAAIPAVIVALIQGSTYLGVNNFIFALIVIGLYLLIQQLENTLIVPRILGEAVDLHPVVVMLGVLVGANVAGILGALLAAPVIASTREILHYLYAKMLGENPYPPRKEEPKVITPSLAEQVKLWVDKGQRLFNRTRKVISRREEETQTDLPGKN